MTRPADEMAIAVRLRSSADETPQTPQAGLRERFAARLRDVASRPDLVPIEFDG